MMASKWFHMLKALVPIKNVLLLNGHSRIVLQSMCNREASPQTSDAASGKHWKDTGTKQAALRQGIWEAWLASYPFPHYVCFSWSLSWACPPSAHGWHPWLTKIYISLETWWNSCTKRAANNLIFLGGPMQLREPDCGRFNAILSIIFYTEIFLGNHMPIQSQRNGATSWKPGLVHIDPLQYGKPSKNISGMYYFPWLIILCT
jgi:hypothetical protein